MSVHHRQPPAHLGRLIIPQGSHNGNIHSQQPQPMYSPGLPTTIQQGMYPPFAMNSAVGIQTPMQQSFYPIPNAQGRPVNHRAHASMMQLANAGIHPPMGMPMTPQGQGQFSPGQFTPGHMMMPSQQFAPHRNRRAPSLSTGGPPKAALGGPAAKNRVVSVPTPPPAPVAAPSKPKKVVVNFPKETVPATGEEPSRRELWARVPLQPSEVPDSMDSEAPDAITLPVYPADQWRSQIPDTVDVFLPGKVWFIHSSLYLISWLFRLLGTNTSKRLSTRSWSVWVSSEDLEVL